MIASTTHPAPRSFQPVSELAARPIRWLWPGRLALGKLAIFDGDPGLGKSLVTLDLCARLSTGRPFPDGGASPGPSGAIVLNGEDGDEDTIRPRLQALGADLERVFIPCRDRDVNVEPLRFPTHIRTLEHAVQRTTARLVVIDPLVAFLDAHVVASSDQSVRWGLAPLMRLAEQYSCAVLLVRHLNKLHSARSTYRGSGSIGFLAACRSGWLIARDPERPERCVLAQVKNNLGPPQPSLAYTVTPNGRELPTLHWLGPTAWTADQLTAARAGAAPATERDRAREFLADFLADGARTSRDVWAAAREENLAVRTIERAKKELEVRSMRMYGEGQRFSYWLLPGQATPAAAPRQAAPPDLEAWLAPLRERFPPSTPLDEL
jgi:hypothetical protein